jgi:hypothetical protein
MTPFRRLTVVLLALFGMILPSAAHADELVGAVNRPTLISAYGGRLAWSQYVPTQNSYVLVTRVAGVSSVVPVAPRAVPFDVDLGPDETGGIVAAYSRCKSDPVGRAPGSRNAIAQLPVWETGRGCDLYRFDFATGQETAIAVANAPHASEFLPTIWKARVAFARVYESKPGLAGRRAYLYARGTSGAARSVRVPAGSRSTGKFCSGSPRNCRRVLEPGPTALDLGGRRLAFGWDSIGDIGPTTAAYFATLNAHPRKHRIAFGGSGSIQAEEVIQPQVDTGQVYWGYTLYGDTTSNALRRYRITTGDYQQTTLPAASAQDAFIRPVLATAVDGPLVYYLQSGLVPLGEPGCTPQSPCISNPGCSDIQPCGLVLTQNPAFQRFRPVLPRR